MRYRLRTLLIVLAALPPVLAAMWFTTPDVLSLMACYGTYGTIAGLALFYHLWMSLHEPN